MQMTKADLDEWLSALRSGEFSQGTKFLNYNDSKFCCLGVLCELETRKGTLEKVSDVGFSIAYKDKPKTTDFYGMALPPSLSKKFDCYRLGPYFKLEDLNFSGHLGKALPDRGIPLSLLNDNGMTFIEIADLLEKHVQIVDSYKETTCS